MLLLETILVFGHTLGFLPHHICTWRNRFIRLLLILPIINKEYEGMLMLLHIFSATFTKGNSFGEFLFASLDQEAVLKWGLLLKERICSCRSKFFPLRGDPNLVGQQK